jgi:hypothetical protein
MSDWSRVVNTTIKDYIKGEEVNILRNRKLPAMMKSKGRITFNHEGRSTAWKVRYRRGLMQGFAMSDTLTFPQIDRWKPAELPWRGYAAGESMTKLERLQNKGMAAIIKVYDNLAKIMMEDMNENFSEEFYIDGNATGNGKRFHGIESFGSNSGVTRPFVANPNDNYAGLSCALGGYGGTWSGDWPSGRGDPQYDFWSPIIVNYTDTNTAAWEAVTKTWRNVCLEALSYGIIKTQRSRSQKGALDTIMLEGEMYRNFVDRLRETSRLNIQSNSSNSTMIKLGFTDVQNYDGVDVTWEYGMPVAQGYGFNFDEMELMSLQGQLFVPTGPDYDIASQSYRFSVDAFGNFKFSPRNFLFFKAVT